MSKYSFQLIPKAAEEYLTDKRRVVYEDHRKEFAEWLSVFGKNPERVEGYAEDTVKRTMYRIGVFERFVWEREGFVVPLTHAHAHDYMMYLAKGDFTGSHRHLCRAALKRYFRWRTHQYNEDEWEPPFTFTKDNNTQPREFFTVEERKKIRQAALDYGSIPSYTSISADEREKWKKYVSQRLRKPLAEVEPDDWKEVNGWKFTSMVWTSLDAGLRPIEVGRATTDWVDLENGALRIPVEDSSKNRDNWTVSITMRTAEALERWLEERENYPLYEDTDALWLTREGNPYTPQPLRRLILKLCEEAGISTENRKISWYAIRHSVGTYMTREEDLAATQAQLRHKSPQTTMRYDQVPIEDRRDALDKMG
ncbi:tyrosine-type recombinase/integrase [Natrialbaceae archaeon GCM10025810]|uniref:tyrosine-type recombinase/integrase n=1 Tax=Halovalidus salilacus TaxID=3075124 RepID=UPI003613F7FF